MGVWDYKSLFNKSDRSPPNLLKTFHIRALGNETAVSWIRNDSFLLYPFTYLSIFILYFILFYFIHIPGAKSFFLRGVFCSDPSEEIERIRARG